MRKIHLFLALTILSVTSLMIVAAVGYIVLSTGSTSSPHGSNWMGQMWGGMMSGTGAAQMQTQNAAAPYLGLAFVASVALAIAGIVGIVYFALFPQIRVSQTLATQPQTGDFLQASAVQESAKLPIISASPYESVVKTLTTDERRVVEVLASHDGQYLQKYIRSEAGLSRLQTHRIVARLAERGIVSLEKTGNTNAVMLANWLK